MPPKNLIRYFFRMRQQVKTNQAYINLAQYKKIIKDKEFLNKMNEQYLKIYKHSFYCVKKGSEISTIYHLIFKTSHEKYKGIENIPVDLETKVYISSVPHLIQLEKETDINKIFNLITDPEIHFRKRLFQNEETEDKFVKMCQEMDLNKIKQRDSTEFFYFNEKISAIKIEELLSEGYSFDEIDQKMELWDKCVALINLDNNIDIEKLKEMELEEVNNLILKIKSKTEE